MVYDPWQMFIWLTTSIKSENFRFIDSSAPLLKLKLHSHVIGSFYCISFFIWIAKHIGTNAVMKMRLCYFKDTDFYHIIGKENWFLCWRFIHCILIDGQLQSLGVILLVEFWGLRSTVEFCPKISYRQTLTFFWRWLWKGPSKSSRHEFRIQSV